MRALGQLDPLSMRVKFAGPRRFILIVYFALE
jgi:hypothetical protein